MKAAVYAGFMVLLEELGMDFSSSTKFMDEFTKAQFLPHTEGRLFPTVSISNRIRENVA